MKNYLLLLFIFHHLQADDFNALIMIVKNTPISEKYTRPIIILDNNGYVSVLGKLSDRINKNTIIESKIVTANDMRSPESHGTNIVKIIKLAVENVGIIILIL